MDSQHISPRLLLDSTLFFCSLFLRFSVRIHLAIFSNPTRGNNDSNHFAQNILPYVHVTRIAKQVYTFQKSLPENQVVPALQAKVDTIKGKLSTVNDLRNPALRSRHWEKINEIIGHAIPHDNTFTLGLLDSLEVWDKQALLAEVSAAASSEASLETMLKKVRWALL